MLPYPWSFYCGVYSPHRLFCKSSAGTDFTYDPGYSERKTLENPEGVRFYTLGGAAYALEIEPEQAKRLRGNAQGVALLLAAGRDGFGPTSCFGWECSGMCSAVHSVRNIFR